jgi:hypothetical protein
MLDRRLAALFAIVSLLAVSVVVFGTPSAVRIPEPPAVATQAIPASSTVTLKPGSFDPVTRKLEAGTWEILLKSKSVERSRTVYIYATNGPKPANRRFEDALGTASLDCSARDEASTAGKRKNEPCTAVIYFKLTQPSVVYIYIKNDTPKTQTVELTVKKSI